MKVKRGFARSKYAPEPPRAAADSRAKQNEKDRKEDEERFRRLFERPENFDYKGEYLRMRAHFEEMRKETEGLKQAFLDTMYRQQIAAQGQVTDPATDHSEPTLPPPAGTAEVVVEEVEEHKVDAA